MYTAIVLAAGQSSRMGEPKGLLPWKGKPLLAHQLEQLELSQVDRTILVLGHKPEQYRPYVSQRTQVVWNEEWELGKTSSIIKGLSALESNCQAILFVNIDQPVSQEIIDRLITSHREGRGDIHIPVFRDRRGHPVLFSSQLLLDLYCISEETQGLKELIRKYRNKIVHVHMSDSSVLYNFNTPADYEKGRRT